MSHLLTYYWPKQDTESNPESELEGTTRLHVIGCRYRTDKEMRPSMQLTYCRETGQMHAQIIKFYINT